MKNKKFSIEVIEEGRLNRKEANEIVGGEACSFVCQPAYHTNCALYTNCSTIIYGITDDKDFDTLCRIPENNNYKMCAPDPTIPGDRYGN